MKQDQPPHELLLEQREGPAIDPQMRQRLAKFIANDIKTAASPAWEEIPAPRRFTRFYVTSTLCVAAFSGLIGFAIGKNDVPAEPAPSPPRTIVVETPTTPPPPIAEPAVATPFPEPPRTRASSTSRAESDSAAELRLVDAARSAIAQRQFEEGIGIVRRHAARYPNGEFAEERDALEIRALVGLGRLGEARVQMVGFDAAYPQSASRPRLRRLIDALGAKTHGTNTSGEIDEQVQER